MMNSFNIAIFLYYCVYLILPSVSVNPNPLLLIVSFDGFRYDYLERNLTNFIVNLRKNASYSPFMTSVFPTKTFPNHFSISTGLYAEVHGVLDNEVFDQLTNKTLKYGYDLFHYNSEVAPIWILNEMAGNDHRSGCMMWPGSNFEYHNVTPSYYMEYNRSVEYKDRINTLLSWFKDPHRPINLGMMYFDQPDVICHSFGPNSHEVDKQITQVNNLIQFILQKADEANLLNRLNIVFLSDHGGQAVKVPDNLITLDDFVNKSWYNSAGVPPNLQIYPIEGKETEVLAALKGARGHKGGNFSTYTKEEIPDHWHFKHCTRVPPIYISADVGYFFNTRYLTFNTSEIGTHGYEPNVPTMRGFFMALGPAFKRNHLIPPFQNIHIYPMVAHMLGLALPALKPNGSISYLEGILISNEAGGEDNKLIYIVTGAIVAVLGVLVILICFIRRRHQQEAITSVATYKVLNQQPDDGRLYEAQETLSSDCEDISPT